MSDLLIREQTLTAIGDAIRIKSGTSELIAPADMPDAIANIPSSGDEPVVESKTITANGTYTAPAGTDGYTPIVVNVPTTGPEPTAQDLTFEYSLQSTFKNNRWNWIIENYGDLITTRNITGLSQTFRDSTNLTNIPFSINFDSMEWSLWLDNAFCNAQNLTALPTVNFQPNTSIQSITEMFYRCYRLRNIPDDFFNNCVPASSLDLSLVFGKCFSLRNFPTSLNNIVSLTTTISGDVFSYDSSDTGYTFDEIRDFPVFKDGPHIALIKCGRLKAFTFKTNDGTPINVYWHKQTIGMSPGYLAKVFNSNEMTTKYNSGITNLKNIFANDESTVADAKVRYNYLKNDPDWFAQSIKTVSYTYKGQTSNPYIAKLFSRYNHDSAVETINSLPYTHWSDCVIRFSELEGAETDGGAVGDLTAEEIAVATSKNWTVSYM